MSDTEKRAYGSDDGNGNIASVHADIPQYTGFKGFYYKPKTQIVMLGFVCFMGPGLFNAMNGLGGGGQLDETTGANANSALYATFAAMAFFSGCVHAHLIEFGE